MDTGFFQNERTFYNYAAMPPSGGLVQPLAAGGMPAFGAMTRAVMEAVSGGDIHAPDRCARASTSASPPPLRARFKKS